MKLGQPRRKKKKKKETEEKSYDEIEQSPNSFFHGSYKVSIVNWDVSFHKLKLDILCIFRSSEWSKLALHVTNYNLLQYSSESTFISIKADIFFQLL